MASRPGRTRRGESPPPPGRIVLSASYVPQLVTSSLIGGEDPYDGEAGWYGCGSRTHAQHRPSSSDRWSILCSGRRVSGWSSFQGPAAPQQIVARSHREQLYNGALGFPSDGGDTVGRQECSTGARMSQMCSPLSISGKPIWRKSSRRIKQRGNPPNDGGIDRRPQPHRRKHRTGAGARLEGQQDHEQAIVQQGHDECAQ